MSKVDEGKLLDELGKIVQRFAQVFTTSLKLKDIADAGYSETMDLIQVVQRGIIESQAPEAFGKPINYWILTEGPNGPFELLKMMDTEEYRMLRAEVEDKDHPIFHDFGDKNYRIWLMRDGETIGRKTLTVKT